MELHLERRKSEVRVDRVQAALKFRTQMQPLGLETGMTDWWKMGIFSKEHGLCSFLTLDSVARAKMTLVIGVYRIIPFLSISALSLSSPKTAKRSASCGYFLL